MTNKKLRLGELSKIHPLGAIDHRRLQNDNGRLSFLNNMSREARRKLKSESKRLAQSYNQILNQLAKSGARFPVDQVLRQMALEYTHRYASSGIYTQPTSFNYFEPFLHIKLIRNIAPYTEVEPEFNHLFNAEDFFDYITSEDSNSFVVSSLMDLAQDQIFHFSTNGLVTDISFLNGEGREFVIAGFSMIRRGDSLHWYLIGGEALSEDEWQMRCSEQITRSSGNFPSAKRQFLLESMAKHVDFRGRPVPLEETQNHIRTIIAGEFDLREKKHLSRCYLAEHENSFDVICDDPEIFSDVSAETRTNLMTIMTDRFRRSTVLWSLAEGLFQLPSYFNVRLAINAEAADSLRKRLPKKKGGKGLSGSYIVIPALETNSCKSTSAITTVTLPQYEIENEGHWKKLPAQQLGVDRHGNQVRGRTWITSSCKWKPLSSNSTTIFLKDTLRSAKLKIAQYIEASGKVAEDWTSEDAEHCSNEGELYIMRCSAMKEQIYKVGFTEGDATERARQLSSATGVPMAFIVIKKWRHVDAKKLETEVHMLLAPYRINDSREFFYASYDSLEKIIESVIARTSS